MLEVRKNSVTQSEHFQFKFNTVPKPGPCSYHLDAEDAVQGLDQKLINGHAISVGKV